MGLVLGERWATHFSPANLPTMRASMKMSLMASRYPWSLFRMSKAALHSAVSETSERSNFPVDVNMLSDAPRFSVAATSESRRAANAEGSGRAAEAAPTRSDAAMKSRILVRRCGSQWRAPTLKGHNFRRRPSSCVVSIN